MKSLRLLFLKLLRIINYFFPKDNKKVVFTSFPDFSDNTRALFEYMVKQEYFDNFRFIWVVSKDACINKSNRATFLQVKEGFLNFNFIKYLFHVFTAKYLFCTHVSFIEATSKRQVSVCTWHGTMLKRICEMNEREKGKNRYDQFTYILSPSDFYISLFCQSFKKKENSILVCGYPRNDLLFQESDVFAKLGLNIKNFRKLIVYMPTFRSTQSGGFSDSETESGCINTENKESMLRLSSILSDYNILLILKWHPADVRQSFEYSYKNIVSLNNKDLHKRDIQMYNLLHYADALITDYSSVFCDYLLLDRPIAFDVSDIESYNSKRGFIFNRPLEMLPGNILKSEKDVIKFVSEIGEDIDTSIKQRHNLFHYYNNFKDGYSSRRVVEKIFTNIIE